MAIPIAARMGLTVVTNGSARNEERVRNLGASVFLDYKTQRYVDELHDVDCVLDTLGERELPDLFGKRAKKAKKNVVEEGKADA